MNKKYRRLLADDSKENDFWPSFTDLLTTILLVILLVLLGIITKEQLEAKAKSEELEAQAAKIEQQEEVINYLMGVKKEIIEDLIAEFAKTDLKMEIDEKTGAIKFQNDLLFETGKSEIRPEFKQQLQSFIPTYIDIIYGKYSEHLAEIVVEGHTDDVGQFMNNLELSQNRAFSVVRYVLSDEFGEFPYKGEVKDVITANGRSESQLKYLDEEKKEVDRKNSRRVEFKFRLKANTEWDKLFNDVEGAEFVEGA